MPDVAPEAISDAGFVVDVALGVVGESISVAAMLVRGAAKWTPLRARDAWRPAHLPARHQLASPATELARRGAQHREWASGHLDREMDRWIPVLAEMVVSRLDLTGLVIRHVDLDAVIHHVDLVAVVEDVIVTIDLPAIIRESSGSMASGTVRGARMTGIAVDDAISRSLELLRSRRRSPGTPASLVEAP